MKAILALLALHSAKGAAKDQDATVVVLSLFGLAALAIVAAVIVNRVRARKDARSAPQGED